MNAQNNSEVGHADGFVNIQLECWKNVSQMGFAKE